ncbi:nitroreductase family deazaflavin-dependent oxidoreductase [Candidatus Leptofilum sp.]|uniref:nitroreductase family deazaflavin-dependent oxidoreductase n=1 Tax=Candidatus Leptofilum sp. TaxID=3241576 RepID=UPI003B598F72
MTTVTPETERNLRQVFRRFNRFMLLMWRLGFARFINISPEKGGQIMVIQHIGHKTGKVRQTPVNFAEIDGEIYCTAGFGKVSHWYRNLLAHPDVELWLPNGRFHAHTQDITDQPDALPILRQVLINSGFAAPAAGLHPKTMSDEELAAATASYRLFRFTKTQPAAGKADLLWVWPVLACLLLGIVVIWFKRLYDEGDES